MRRPIFAVACILSILLAGCQSNCATTGWRFEVGKPSTMYLPLGVHQGSGDLSVAGLATGIPQSIAPAFQQPSSFQQSGSSGASGGFSGGSAGGSAKSYSAWTKSAGSGGGMDDCTMQDVCRILRGIDARLQQQGSAGPKMGLKMPVGPQSEE